MARRFSGARGQSGSLKPSNQEPPAWLSYKPSEVEALVSKMAKDKLTASMIGLKLRDSYGIPSVQSVTKKSITEILAEKKLGKSIPQDLIDCIRQAVNVQKHLETNPQDRAAQRGLSLAQSRIGRLAKYYKRTNKIPADWKFDPTIAGMYLE